MSKKISILIVDDSRIFRSALEECLKGLGDMQVIGSAFNGEKALEFIQKDRPDLVTLDVEMPGLDGLETLKEILKINKATPDLPPIRVLMLSAFTKKGADITMQALELGAYDFLAKPQSKSPEEGMQILKNLLVLKIRQLNSKNIQQEVGVPEVSVVKKINSVDQKIKGTFAYDAVLIGVSTGGPKALMEFLPALCEVIDVPVYIVQHMPPKFTASLANGLNAKCKYSVVEAQDGEEVQRNGVYIAPGGRHMIIRKSGTRIRTVITDQDPENGCRPSADVLFRSAPSVYGGKLLVIVLTGMGNDGAKSLSALKRSGAKVIAQDEESCVVWGMPGSAVATGNVDVVLPLNKMASAINLL